LRVRCGAVGIGAGKYSPPVAALFQGVFAKSGVPV